MKGRKAVFGRKIHGIRLKIPQVLQPTSAHPGLYGRTANGYLNQAERHILAFPDPPGEEVAYAGQIGDIVQTDDLPAPPRQIDGGLTGRCRFANQKEPYAIVIGHIDFIVIFGF
nr:hypothetical protein [Bifidobacterium asteroides]